MVLPLVEGDAAAASPLIGVFGVKLHLAGSGHIAADVHAALKRSHVLVGEGELYGKGIGLVHVAGGREEAVGEVSVVGQEHEPRGVLVQSSAGEQGGTDAAKLLGEKIQHRLLSAVLGGTDHAVGLVQEDVGELSVGHGLTLEDHGYRVGVDLHIRLFRGDAVHQHLAAPYRLGGLGAGGDAGEA